MNKVKEFFNKLASDWDRRSKSDLSNIKDILSHIKISENDKILDLGCGTGIITSLLSSYTTKKVIGIDISNNMIKIAKSKNIDKKVVFKCRDFYKLFLNKYNLIVCFDAYPHFVNQKGFVLKAHKLLTKNGTLAIIFDNDTTTTNGFHKNIESELSRNILQPNEEGKLFENYFKIIFTLEEKNKYILLLQKK